MSNPLSNTLADSDTRDTTTVSSRRTKSPCKFVSALYSSWATASKYYDRHGEDVLYSDRLRH